MTDGESLIGRMGLAAESDGAEQIEIWIHGPKIGPKECPYAHDQITD